MHGLVLTQTDDLTRLISDLHAAHIPALKVVTGWGYAWNEGSRQQVLTQLPLVILRTVNGDGCRPPPPGQSHIFLEPQAVLSELSPWLRAAPDLWVELGNEPNIYNSSDDAAWVFQWWFAETVRQLRAAYPRVRVVAPGLAMDHRADAWWAICHAEQAFDLADCIGFHCYAWHNFTAADNGGQLQAAVRLLSQYYPLHPWLGTEAGINDSATSATVKADRYCVTHQKLPSQVLGVCWYHTTQHPSDADQSAYNLPPSAWGHLKAGGSL